MIFKEHYFVFTNKILQIVFLLLLSPVYAGVKNKQTNKKTLYENRKYYSKFVRV